MKNIFILLISLSSLSGWAQTDSLQYYFNNAKAARESGDSLQFYHHILQAHRLHPTHPTILWMAGLASSLVGHTEESSAFVRKALHLNAYYKLDAPELKQLRSSAEFEDIASLQKNLQEPVINSDTAFVIKDRSLHIESITAGEAKDVFYCGSIHKRMIIRVNENGEHESFTTGAQDGLTAVFGVKVDAKKNILWACSSPMEEMENFDTVSRSAVFKYDVKSQKLIKKYFPSTGDGHIFGDLCLDGKGNAYISDSRNNIIFKVNEDKGMLEPFFYSPEFKNLQGLTFSDDGEFLFIADYIKGIYRLTLKDKSLIRLRENFDLSTKSVDGLTYYQNSLIGIQNLIFPMRAVRYHLNEAKDELGSYTIIDKAHPAFNEPTIGCISGNDFYYVANSLWSGYDDKRKLKPESELQDVVVLTVTLD